MQTKRSFADWDFGVRSCEPGLGRRVKQAGPTNLEKVKKKETKQSGANGSHRLTNRDPTANVLKPRPALSPQLLLPSVTPLLRLSLATFTETATQYSRWFFVINRI